MAPSRIVCPKYDAMVKNRSIIFFMVRNREEYGSHT